MADSSMMLALVVALLLAFLLEALHSAMGHPLGRAVAFVVAIFLALLLDCSFALLERVFEVGELPRYAGFAILQGVTGYFIYRGLEHDDRAPAVNHNTEGDMAQQSPPFDYAPFEQRETTLPGHRRRAALAAHPEYALHGDVWQQPASGASAERSVAPAQPVLQAGLGATRPNLSAIRSIVRRPPTQEAPAAWGDLPTLPYLDPVTPEQSAS